MRPRSDSSWNSTPNGRTTRPRIRPIEIPPLVTQHLPWLLPTSRNKMFNAVLDEQSEQPFTRCGLPEQVGPAQGEPGSVETGSAGRPEFRSSSRRAQEGRPSSRWSALFDAKALVDIIEQESLHVSVRGRSVRPKVTFYRRLIESGELKDFLVILPQPATEMVEIGDVGSRPSSHEIAAEGVGGSSAKSPIVSIEVWPPTSPTAIRQLRSNLSTPRPVVQCCFTWWSSRSPTMSLRRVPHRTMVIPSAA